LLVPLMPLGAAMTAPVPQPVETLNNLAGLVVLVVEDDALAREGLVSLLESWGYVVGVADGLSAALSQLEAGLIPDVIVSDYRLRDEENGIKTIRQLRTKAGWLIPACLMSGDTDAGLMQAATEASLTLLHKPVRPAKLRSLIRHLAADVQASGADLV
jgi:CheY-like chemotaxis protein